MLFIVGNMSKSIIFLLGCLFCLFLTGLYLFQSSPDKQEKSGTTLKACAVSDCGM